MASLVNKDSYLQNLAKKICAQEVHELRKRKFGTDLRDEGTPPKKKKKKIKKSKKQDMTPVAAPGKHAAPQIIQGAVAKPGKKPDPTNPMAVGAAKTAPVEGKGNRDQKAGAAEGKGGSSSFSALTLLRQRLHEKIQEVSNQGSAQELSPAVLQKRQRRKYEKERKKRRRKELKMKEKMEKQEAKVAAAAVSETETQKEESKAQLVFNKVDVGEEKVPTKAEKKKEKKKAVKGNITPLTGKNYKQLLSRLEARKSKLEELKDKDEKKAKDLEMKMKWTNALYKAEGVKIRDDEDRLKAALKRKEKRKAQRQRQWEKRTEQVVEKMQQRQEKRRKNLQKKKLAKVEKKKAKARKKGRILPEDLEKAGFK